LGGDERLDVPSLALALQLFFMELSESIGNHDSKIMGADSLD
jgi:hypothetical protein